MMRCQLKRRAIPWATTLMAKNTAAKRNLGAKTAHTIKCLLMTLTDTQEEAVSKSWKRQYHCHTFRLLVLQTNMAPNISHPNVLRNRDTPPVAKKNSIVAMKADDN